MASDTNVETTIKLSDSSEAQLGDLVNHRMIITNGDTNGQVLDPAVGPTVLEMSCSAENATENSIDRQKYESRQREYKEEEEDGTIVKHKNYEETAVRSREQTTDDGEVTSNSTVKFEEQEKVRHTDEGAKVAEYKARCEEKHETSVSTVEKIGDREFTRTRSSQKSLTKTCRRIEEMEDNAPTNGDAITETSESNETSQSSGVEKADNDDVIVKRSEKTTKSEHSSTKVTGKGDPSVFDKYEELLTSSDKPKGALIDLGALGEIKLSTQVVSGENTLERDFKTSEYFNPDLVGLDFGSCDAAASKEKEKQVDVSNTDGPARVEVKHLDNESVSQHDKHAQEITSASSESSSQVYNSSRISSSSSSQSKVLAEVSKTRSVQQQSLMAEQNGHADSMDRDRGVGGEEEADDNPRSLPPSFTTKQRWHDDDDYEPHSLPPPFAPKNRRETDDLIQRILSEAKMKGSSSSDGEASKKQKVKIDMGGEKEQYEQSSSHASTLSEASSSKMEERNYMQNESSRVVGAERRRTTQEDDEQMSLFERRLAMGVENKLANIFSGDEDERERHHSLESDRSRSSYASGASHGHKSKYSMEAGATAAVADSQDAAAFDDVQSKYTRRSERDEFSDIHSKYSDEGDKLGELDIQSKISDIQSKYSEGDKLGDIQSKYSEEGDTLGELDIQSKISDIQSKYARELDDIQSKYSHRKNEPDEFDELDEEINAWRTKYREQQQRRQRAYMDEEGEESGVGRYQGRGRLVRQGYMETDEGNDPFAIQRRPPPPDYIPDEEFEPVRRAETSEIVTERTAEIRTVIDKQSSVLEKLRSASSSFDELTSEIRTLKQQVIENSARRSCLMDGNWEDDDDDPSAAPAPPARPGRFNRYASGSQSFDFSNYTPGSYSTFRQNRLADVDRDFSDKITSGSSLGLARYNNKYSATTEDDVSYSGARSRFGAKSAARFGRSKSLYDDSPAVDDDDKSDGDEFEEYRPRARPLPSQEEENRYTPSVGPGYGSGHASGDPDLGRSSYMRPRYTTSDDSSPRLSYTSRFGTGTSATSATTSSYKSRLSRANTLSDFDFDRPSSQFDRSSASSGFSSRFLNKVRENRSKNPEGEEIVATKRDKPFKSRFLRQSFDSSDLSSSSSRYSSRFLSSSTTSNDTSKTYGDSATASSNGPTEPDNAEE